MNKVMLMGRLTATPELRTTPSGKSVCTFNIAVNRRFKSRDGEQITDFFRITVWHGQGEACARYLEKGKQVAVIGELHASIYEGRDGQARVSLEVAADEVEFLSPRSEGTAETSVDMGEFVEVACDLPF